MRKRIITLVTLIIITLLGIIIILNNKNKPYEITGTNNGQFAFYYEDENGEYQRSDESKWSTGYYVLNRENSTCDGESNPTFLSWNSSSYSVVLTRNKATKCSLYFDKKLPSIFDKCSGTNNLVECILQVDGGITEEQNITTDLCPNGIGTIYKHDETLTDGAKDNGYRYSGCNPNNYICFGNGSENYNLGFSDTCPTQNKYRIIGYVPVTINGKQEFRIKVIKAEYLNENEFITKNGTAYYVESYSNLKRMENDYSNISAYQWDSAGNNTWGSSSLNKSLNSDYLNLAFNDNWQQKIETVSWNVGGVNNYEMTPQEMYQMEAKGSGFNTQTDGKIGLMYNYDYAFASSSSNWNTKLNAFNNSNNRANNWMFNSVDEWTISPYTLNSSDSSYVFSNGYYNNFGTIYRSIAIRPTFYLTKDTVVMGNDTFNGSVTTPFKIQITYDYDYKPEAQEFIAPVEGDYKIELWGASGGDYEGYYGGKGAYTTGIIHLKENDKLYIYTGQQGFYGNTELVPYNGGGKAYWSGFGATGGGATDVRLAKTDWKDFDSLKSRIMVAAGGGGANNRNKLTTEGQYFGAGNGGAGGALVGINGEIDLIATENPNSKTIWGYFYGTGGSQTKAGTGVIGPNCVGNVNADYKLYPSEGYFGYANVNQSTGGGGYFGGGGGEHAGGGGGSSFISGYQGCVAIENTSSEENIISKCTEENALNNIACSYHYSGKIFTGTLMKAGNESMPSPSGDTETGHLGNGHAKISLVSIPEKNTSLTTAIDMSDNHYDGDFIGNLKIQKDDEGRQGLYFDGNESYVDIADLPETIKWNDGFSYEFEAKWLAFNYYSRIFDFGNGAGLDNIVFCNLQRRSRAFPSILYGYKHYEDDSSAVTGLVLNKSVKVKVSYEKTDNGFNEIIYKDGELARTKFYETENLVTEVNRTLNYLGKSNWSGEEYFNGYIYNIKFTDSKGKPILWYDFSR